MSTADESLEWYFLEAIGFEDSDKRDEWLITALGNNHQKLEQIRALIAGYSESHWIAPPRIVEETQAFLGNLKGTQVGPFLLREKIGSGGMGDVYLAEQISPVNRFVAIKLILNNNAHHQIVERFQLEKQLLASMEHPNIARIIDAGTTKTGISYIAMEHVNGVDLLEYCNRNKPTIRAKIELLLQCCRAIQHAHQRGIIHRDIKPSNVMVAQVDGEPMIKVIDFGIAKASCDERQLEKHESLAVLPINLPSMLTIKGSSPGTPPYMSPEQFPGGAKEVDIRSDIYSLGALLYALLTQQDPFDQEDLSDKSFAEIGDMVRNIDPLLPSERSPASAKTFKGDLDSIVRKAMHRDVEKRYQSVLHFSEDLRNYLTGDVVSANPESSWTQLKRVARRNRAIIGTASLALAGLLLAFAGVIFGLVVAIKQRKSAMIDAQDANLLSASMRIQRQEFSTALSTLDSIALEISDSSSRLDYRLLRSQIPRPPNEFARATSKIYFGILIPKQDAIACACQDSSFMLFDRNHGELIWQQATGQREINGLALSPDESILATTGDDGTLKLWNLKLRTCETQMKASNESLFQVAWSPDGKYLITAASEPFAKIWSYPDLKLIRQVDTSGGKLECVTASKQGLFAIGDNKGKVHIGNLSPTMQTDFQSGQHETLFSQNHSCSSLAFSKSGQLLAIGLNKGYLTLLRKNIQGFQSFKQLQFPYDVSAVSFSEDERKLAIGESSGQLHVLDIDDPWEGKFRIDFTDEFYELHPELFSGIGDPVERRKKLRASINRCDPPDALDDLPIEIDRIRIEFKTPLTNIVRPNQFARMWTSGSMQSDLEQIDNPLHVLHNDGQLELVFQMRRNYWSDPAILKRDRKLESWSAHKSRISSILWDKSDQHLYSFSEDRTIRRLNYRNSWQSIVDTNAINIFPINSNSVLLHEKPNYRVSKHQFANQVPKINPQYESTDQEDRYPQIAQGTNGIFAARQKTNAASLDSTWTIYRFDPSTELFEASADLSPGLHVAQLIGSPSRNQWIGRFSRSDSDGKLDLEKNFLALWDGRKQAFVWTNPVNSAPFRHVDMSPDSTFLIYEKDAAIHGVDIRTGADTPWIQEPGLSVSCMKFSPDSNSFAVALNKERIIRCYEIQSNQLKKLWEMRQHGGPINQIHWSKDQKVLMSIGQDGLLRTYDLESLRLSAEISLPFDNPSKILVSPNEDSVFIMDSNGAIFHFDCD